MLKIYLIVALSLPLLISSTTHADDASDARIEKISNLAIQSAERLCKAIGSSTTMELSGSAKAELASFAKKLADVDANAAAKFKSDEYEGVLRENLEGESKDPIKCKQKVYNDYINRVLPPGAAWLDSNQTIKLAQGRTLCNDGEFEQANNIFMELLSTASSNPAILQAKNDCTSMSEEYKTIEFGLLYSPGVFMQGEGDTPFLARFDVEIDDSYCGMLSNTNGTDFVDCSLKPGKQSYKLKHISIYSPNKQTIYTNSNCGGMVDIKPSNDKYGVILCLAKSMIKCGIMPFGGTDKFTHANCPF